MNSRKSRGRHEDDNSEHYEELADAREAEQSVLGVILQKPELLPDVHAGLGDGRYFSDSRNQLIYLEACELYREGKQPNYATLVVHLETKGLLDRAGTTSYMDELLKTDNCLPSLLEQHCEQIREAYIAERLNQAARAAQDSLRSGTPPAEVRHALVSSVDDLPWGEVTAYGLQFVPIAEILRASAGITWCVKGLIPANSLGIVSGDSNSGKTWHALTLAISVASGEKLLGVFDVTQAPVLIIDQEMGPDFLGDRLRKLGATDSLPIHIACLQELALETANGQGKLVDAIRQCHPGLVIIDPLIGACDCDENSASEVKRLTRGVLKIARREKCVIAVVHHSRKEGLRPGKLGDRLRGSGEFRAGIDWHINLEIDKRDVITCRHDKLRVGLAIPNFYTKIQTFEDGSVRLMRISDTERRSSKAKMAETIIREILRPAGTRVLRQTILDACKERDIGEGTADTALKPMVGQGEVEEDWDTSRTDRGGTCNQKVYILARD